MGAKGPPGWAGLDRLPQREETTVSHIKGKSKPYTYFVLFQKPLIEFLNVFQKQKDPNYR